MLGLKKFSLTIELPQCLESTRSIAIALAQVAISVAVMYQTKCERYWSEEVGGTVEVEEANLKATTTSITTHRDFVVRTMTLKKVIFYKTTSAFLAELYYRVCLHFVDNSVR